MRSRDDLRLIVKGVRKKNKNILSFMQLQWSLLHFLACTVFAAHSMLSAVFSVQLLSESPVFFSVSSQSSHCCSIQEDQAVQDFQWNSEGMHLVTHEDAYTRACLDYCRSVLPQSVRKADPDADLFNVSTYQCSIFFNNMGSFHRKSPFRKAENVD